MASCKKCHGGGLVECPTCKGDMNCTTCEGTGVEPTPDEMRIRIDNMQNQITALREKLHEKS